MFPVLFHTRALTRKIGGDESRDEPGLINKILRLEQECERIHSIMNNLECLMTNAFLTMHLKFT